MVWVEKIVKPYPAHGWVSMGQWFSGYGWPPLDPARGRQEQTWLALRPIHWRTVLSYRLCAACHRERDVAEKETLGNVPCGQVE